MDLKKVTVKQWLQFITSSIGAFAIMYVLFCRASFYDAFVEAMGVTNTQFGVCFAVYGWIAVVGYLIGGFVADRVAPRWLMFFSYLATAICNFILGLWPNYTVTLILYAAMGITTTITFWDANLKCVRIFGRSIGAETRAFTWYQIVLGVGEIVIGTAVVWVYTRFTDIVAGLRFVLWFYAGLLAVLAVISAFVYDGAKPEEEQTRSKDDRIMSEENLLQQTLRLIKNPDLWLGILIALGGYNIGSCIGSYLGDIAGIFGAGSAAIAFIGTMNGWFKPIGALAANFITKKKGPTWILQNITWLYMIILVVFLVLPKDPAYLWVYLVLLAIEIILTGAFRCQKYIQLTEAGIGVQDTGNAFGLLATIIYSMDAIMPVFIGAWLDKYTEAKAYDTLFIVLLAFGALTLVASYIFRHRNKDRIQRLLAENNGEK